MFKQTAYSPVLALVVWCFSFSVVWGQQDDTGWQLRREENGITVYTRNLDNSPFDEYKATTVVYNISIDSIYGLISGAYGERFAAKDPMIKKFSILKINNTQEYYTYAIVRISLFQKDRDVVFRVNRRTTAKGYIIEAQSIPDYIPSEAGLIRMGEGRTYYYLARRDDGGVDMVVSAKFDLSGDIPDKVVNRGIVDSAYERLKFVRSQIDIEFALDQTSPK